MRPLERVELSEERFPHVWRALRDGYGEGVAPGFVVGFWHAAEPGVMRAAALGQRRIEPSAQPVSVDTVFDLASVSKVFATATLAAVLIDRGWLRWDTPVREVLPEYPLDGVLVRHLLAHTAGFPAWAPLWQRVRDQFAGRDLWRVPIAERQRAMRGLVFEQRLEARPDERALYSDFSFLLLGFVLEEIARMPLDEAVRRFVWDAMDLRGPYYARTTRDAVSGRDERVAATERCEWRKTVLQGQVHDENCWSMGGYAGHAGVFGTVFDLLEYSRRMVSGGFLSPAALRAAWTRVPVPAACSRTLGWDTPSGDEPSFSKRFSPRSVGHLGFTGTSLWIDPERRLAAVLLTNRVHPTRENTKIRQFRPRFHDSLWHDLRR